MREIDMDLMRRVAESHQGAYGDACREVLRLAEEVSTHAEWARGLIESGEGMTLVVAKLSAAETEIAALRAEVEGLRGALEEISGVNNGETAREIAREALAAPQPEGGSDE